MPPPTMMIDLTGSDDEAPAVRSEPNNFDEPILIEDSPPPAEQMMPASSPHNRRSVSRPSQASRFYRPPSIRDSPEPLPRAKFSPPSATRTRNERAVTMGQQNDGIHASSGPSTSAVKTKITELSDSEDEGDHEEPQQGDLQHRFNDQMSIDSHPEVALRDHTPPSKLPPRVESGSEKSFGRLTSPTGTDSPIAARHRAKKAQIEQEEHQLRRAESPRAVMARNGMQSGQQSHVQQPNASLEESLGQFRQQVREDHAKSVYWRLHDARKAAAETKSPFIDDVDPFAAMKPVHMLPGQAIPDGMLKVRLDTIMSKKKPAKFSTNLLTTKVASNVPRLPKYTSYTIVKRNILCADDEQLKFMPFLGDSKGDVKSSVFNCLVKELNAAYSAKHSGSNDETEMASKINTYLDNWLEALDLGVDRQVLIRYLLEVDSDSLGKSQREIKQLRKASGGSLTSQLAEIAATFSDAFNTVFSPVNLTLVILPDQALTEMLERLNRPDQDNSPDSLHNQTSGTTHTTDRHDTFTTFTCLLCGTVRCPTHGSYSREEIHHGDESEMSDFEEAPAEETSYNHKPVALTYDEMLRVQDGRLSTLTPVQDPGSPCSHECYRTFGDHEMTDELSNEVMVALRSFMISVRPNLQPCEMSFVLDIPCWQVYVTIQGMKRSAPSVPNPSHRRGPNDIDWYDNKRKVLKGNWTELTDAFLHQDRTQITPCAHDGPCNDDCPCAYSNILCEVFCGCPDDCARRFTGCNCHASGLACVSESCICIAMNRECGSQCTSCGAIPRIHPRHKFDDDLFSRGCQNVVLQRGVNRKLLIGESQLEGVGYGLYLGEPVQKGDYLSEYTGEVISTEEAERRGIIYDRKYLSFLFDLNSEWAIDAARLGNKARFLNHAESEQNGLNCEAKILLVNGEHRIKLIALRAIEAGEELLFNYGKKFAEIHGLNKKMPKAIKEGGKKGVIEGEEALDALDGNRARGKWTATRGGHGASGRGGRKATKSAPVRQQRMEDIVAEGKRAAQDDEDEDMPDVDEEGEEEDDDDDENAHARRKRKRIIRRPKRYTR